MKTVEDFFTQLAYGQLKNTPATDDDRVGIIFPEVEDQLLGLVNDGLIDISTRMQLFKGIEVLTFVDAQNIYDMTSYEHFCKVISVHGVDSQQREKTFIPKSSSHVTVPSPSTLRFSNKIMEDYGPSVDIHLHLTHPKVAYADTMDLPPHLYEALALYVSGLYISHMGGEENTAKGDSYYGLYLSMLQTDVTQNKSGTSDVEMDDADSRFYDRGFV